MATPLPTTSDVQPRPITNSSEAQDVIGHLSDVMDALLGVVDQETALVRAGRLSDAAKLEPTKSQLARHYVTDTSRLKISVPYLSKAMPAALTALRERHHNFQALLQINLTVLATAHAISEGIMRGLSEEITRKASPQTYGASGRANAPKSQMGQPLAISRVS
jgi:hypothetical protein